MTTAISLFSGGLDSILASRVVAAQGIRVVAVKFISPFFDYDLLSRRDSYVQEIKRKFSIDVVLKDISEEYIELIGSPAHGYGKHFNPCVDCKIFMISKAREMMAEYGASFLITGEVIGQRPMSQRRDALRVIERDSGCDFDEGGVLLRPLCAKNLKETRAEIEGLVDRDKLYDFSGRGRHNQMRLAKEFGITGYPSPAGGCILTDPVVGERIKRFYESGARVTVSDMLFIQVGRQFRLPGGGWLSMGRRKDENERVAALFSPGDVRMYLADRPGPTAVLRGMSARSDLLLAAGLVARYGKKGADGRALPGEVVCENGKREVIEGIPPDEERCRSLLW